MMDLLIATNEVQPRNTLDLYRFKTNLFVVFYKPFSNLSKVMKRYDREWYT